MDVIKTIESKGSGDKIEAVCETYDGDGECEEVSLYYQEKNSNIVEKLMTLSRESQGSGETAMNTHELDLLISQLESEQMMKNDYKFFGTFRKVCEMGKSPEGSSRLVCIAKMVLPLLAAGGTFAGGAGIVVALGAFAGAGLLMTLVGRDLAIVQGPLLFAALGADLLRAIFFAPFKKIANKVQTKKLNQIIVPLLYELQFEIENAPSAKELYDESAFEEDDLGRLVKVKSKLFKKILEGFRNLDIDTQPEGF
ncbi:MAG: hypothetical protein H6620_07530 [Halobacteriovoraceae bacterium]|nr:hypothetical protein [Halobacteriovoraceae bacterium]